MALTDVPTTQDEESVSDVIMLKAIPETADVVAPPDARHQPQFTAHGGGCRCRGHQPQCPSGGFLNQVNEL